ncbi:hypothetical protein BD289DRAFT_140110 [Coniella lustricola]|uniref:Uncharacterized protein n=1 Tax=Coniella lustricola TaxID=2025994 RepID=A0A2T3AF73_9PEZI|nr:hypothetical protein BD289DRAFT_140110 [Coniella lustricola]
MSGRDTQQTQPQPQPPNNQNPFVKFKQHVDDRIGTGLGVLTGRHQPKRPVTPLASDPHSTAVRDSPSSASAYLRHHNNHNLDMHNLNHTAYWAEWALSSSYSPYNIDYLPQPTPRDLPPDVAASSFGFEDALEDLLATTRGLPLMDLRHHANYKNAVANAFKHNREPPMVWANRLASRGLLLKSALPSLHPADEQEAEHTQHQSQRPASIDEWLSERTARAKEASRAGTGADLAGSLGSVINGWMTNAVNHLDRDVKVNLAETVRQAARDLGMEPDSPETDAWVREMMQKLDWDFAVYHAERAKALTRGEDQKNEKKNEVEKQGEEEPWSDYDLFAAIEGAIAEADRSFGNFARAITGSVAGNDNEHENAGHNRPTTTTTSSSSWPPAGWSAASAQTQNQNKSEKSEHDEVIESSGLFGGKTIRTTTEHIDAFGYVHQKVETTTLDRDGMEVSREARYSVQPMSSEHRGEVAKSTNHRHRGQSEERERDGKANRTTTGWFWR